MTSRGRMFGHTVECARSRSRDRDQSRDRVIDIVIDRSLASSITRSITRLDRPTHPWTTNRDDDRQTGRLDATRARGAGEDDDGHDDDDRDDVRARWFRRHARPTRVRARWVHDARRGAS